MKSLCTARCHLNSGKNEDKVSSQASSCYSDTMVTFLPIIPPFLNSHWYLQKDNPAYSGTRSISLFLECFPWLYYRERKGGPFAHTQTTASRGHSCPLPPLAETVSRGPGQAELRVVGCTLWCCAPVRPAVEGRALFFGGHIAYSSLK